MVVNKRVYRVYEIGIDVEIESNVKVFTFIYVGRGTPARVKNFTNYNEDVVAWMNANPGFEKRIVSPYSDVKGFLTKDESQEYEARLIKRYGLKSEGGILLNKREELTDNKYNALYQSLNKNPSEKDFEDARRGMDRGRDLTTPASIIKEWIEYQSPQPKMKHNMLIPMARYGDNTGDLQKSLLNSTITLVAENSITVKNKKTIVIDDSKKISYGLGNNFGGGCDMSKVNTYCCDFIKRFDTVEKYDSIFLNPPFEDLGEDFIEKCVKLLKVGGCLCVIMSQYWRSIVGKRDQHKKTYNTLRLSGGFILIHMYSDKDAAKLFGQSIGHVDNFVWKRGARIDDTTIINQRGDKFIADLRKYPQAPPVLPPEIYDQYFDQVNGLKYYRYPANGGNSDTNPRTIKFFDITTNKEAFCCEKTRKRSMGKKVIIDQSAKGYWIDDVGDIIVNDRPMIFFNTEDEKNAIIKALTFIIDNKDLFMNKNNIYIPGIKR